MTGAFEALLCEDSKLCESFASNQWFGAIVKLPKSRDLSELCYILF